MRYAMIMAGGAGTRLWPMSRAGTPKQLIPLIHGKSLLQLACERLDGLVPSEQCYLCAGRQYREAILAALPQLSPQRYLGEPIGRDTLCAVGLGAAVLNRDDPQAVVGVFTADHLIEPVREFQKFVRQGFELAERAPETLVTFGIAPTGPSTAYGYLELGTVFEGAAWIVKQFQEKPSLETARTYYQQGPARYLWNSGMFVWRAKTLLECIRRYVPEVFQGLSTIAQAWNTPDRDRVLDEIFPTLKKISVDFAVMEPAARDPAVKVAAVPMPLRWQDVGSWPIFADTCPRDEKRNALGAGEHLLLESSHCLAASSDPDHLIAAIGCHDLMIIHTPDATLVCRADRAEEIKKLHLLLQEKYGTRFL
ncbi:MAG: mannose-1-phosphate guanylyltransferase [Pirellulales bacterium]|nr:mannose-1-phosphate guanylyltransferase [Pirellulales bacterium]